MRWAIGHLLTAVSKSSGNGAHPGAPCIRPSCDPGSGLIYWGPGRATLLVCCLHGLRAVPDTMGGMKFSHWVGAGGGGARSHVQWGNAPLLSSRYSEEPKKRTPRKGTRRRGGAHRLQEDGGLSVRDTAKGPGLSKMARPSSRPAAAPALGRVLPTSES